MPARSHNRWSRRFSGRAESRSGRSRGAALAAAVAVALGAGAYTADAWAPWEGDSIDLRFGMRAAERPDDVVVIAIDDATFAALETQWPFPRSLHADAIDRLRSAGVKQIAYDVQFTEPTRPREDMALFEAARRAGNVVFATTEVDERGRTNVLGGEANLAEAKAVAAASNVPTDRGGVIRHFSYEEAQLKTFAVTTAERATGRIVRRDLFTDGGARIDYRGPPGTIETFTFADLVRGEVPRRALRGRVAVVGAAAPTLQDVHPTPTSGTDPMSGPEIQANAIWTAMHGVPLRDVAPWVDLLAIIALSLLAPIASMYVRPMRLGLIAPLAALTFAVIAKVAFDHGWVVAFTYPIASLVAGTIAAITAGYVAESGERRRVSRHKDLLEEEVQRRTAELRATQLEVVRRLGQAAESRDRATGEHIERIGRLCHQMGLATGMSVQEAELLRDASALHDLGKIGIPDSVLLKPGEFTAQERELMRTHTLIGAEILAGSSSRLVQVAELIARTHHERWDGSGYPAGLRGEEIPIEGRICAICDVFDALMSERSYKPGWSLEESLAEIHRQSGKAFDPYLVELFLDIAPRLERTRLKISAPRADFRPERDASDRARPVESPTKTQ